MADNMKSTLWKKFLKLNIALELKLNNYTRYSMNLASRFDILCVSLELIWFFNNLQLQLV